MTFDLENPPYWHFKINILMLTTVVWWSVVRCTFPYLGTTLRWQSRLKKKYPDCNDPGLFPAIKMSTGAAFCRQTSTPQPQIPTRGTAGTPTEAVRLRLDGRPSLRIFQTCHGCAITFGSVWGCHWGKMINFRGFLLSLTIRIHIRWFLFLTLRSYKGHWVLIWAVWTFCYTVLIFN